MNEGGADQDSLIAAQALAKLTLRRPWSMQRFVEQLSLQRDRPIEIIEGLGEFESMDFSGIWIPLPEKDLIRHRSGFTRIERDGIIAHELGHIILGHEVPPEERIQYFQRTASSIPAVVIKRLMDQQACLRSNFDLPLERQAEWFATLLMEAAAALSQPLFPDRDLNPRQRLMLERAAAIFGWSA
ncbi:ImmA/IrrE family metallo-endopeptidase [Nocardia sp. CNY236]|uniref:ImmA/IrrE family metallo-endopeptidase n=1 Tax=Nocardia sp. CNY236 TaxID=1169152 RepID=UPI0004054927|nr:ImmA/IrrE family metallo-endopeptidase [Nocardia sp. CNY236]